MKSEWAAGGFSIKLPHHLPEAFNLFVNWLYMHSLPIKRDDDEAHMEHHVEWNCLVAAYVLGEELLDTDFKDTVIDVLCAKTRSPLGHTIWLGSGRRTATIYSGTPEDSVARRFLRDVFVSHAAAVDIVIISRDARKEFLVDVLVFMADRRKIESLARFEESTSKCAYYSHGKDGRCYLD